ncbi:MAG: extracellular solute-binding protein [Patescibacteria group bacterium]
MKGKSFFQLGVIATFVVLLFVGLLGFSGKIPLPGRAEDKNYGEVVVWGTLPNLVMQNVIADKLGNEKNIVIKYVEKSKASFDEDFVEALASGQGPDLIIIGQDQMIRNLNKIALVSYAAYPERTFKDIFVEEGEMFMLPQGLIAIPLTIDPLVMYWNRDIFTNASIATPPKKWSEFYDIVPRIVLRDRNGEIARAAVSFGEYKNVTSAKEILSLLMMQAGSSIVIQQGGVFAPALSQGVGVTLSVGEASAAAVQFFTQFSKSDRDSYSWNRSLPASRAMFESGDLAVYFGYASERPAIKLRNPHLNFDLAPVPQTDQAQKRMTFGRVQGAAMVRASRNPDGALRAAILLGTAEFSGGLAARLSIPPVRRDLLAVRPSDAVSAILYDSALIARAWPDPSPSETDQIFGNMIDDIVSSRFKISQALGTAQSALQKVINKYQQQ